MFNPLDEPNRPSGSRRELTAVNPPATLSHRLCVPTARERKHEDGAANQLAHREAEAAQEKAPELAVENTKPVDTEACSEKL